MISQTWNKLFTDKLDIKFPLKLNSDIIKSLIKETTTFSHMYLIVIN